MRGRQPERSPYRWPIMQALADTDTPLTNATLADMTGTSRTNVRDLLLRPRAARWVTAERVPGPCGMGWSVQYTITDLGRKILTEHLATPDKEG